MNYVQKYIDYVEYVLFFSISLVGVCFGISYVYERFSLNSLPFTHPINIVLYAIFTVILVDLFVKGFNWIFSNKKDVILILDSIKNWVIIGMLLMVSFLAKNYTRSNADVIAERLITTFIMASIIVLLNCLIIKDVATFLTYLKEKFTARLYKKT
jgi:H+/Cl- antiporter ClcA